MDTHFLRWIDSGEYGQEAKLKFANSKAYKVWLCTYNCKLPKEVFIVKVWENYSRGFRAFPSTMRNGIGHGNNSGYGALNLAACLGASPIYLLGFDMNYKKTVTEGLFEATTRTHWHEGHPQPHKPHTVRKFIQYFQLPAIKAKERGFEIINLNPDSALPYFLKKHYKEVLH
jgi:hypothetical protein